MEQRLTWPLWAALTVAMVTTVSSEDDRNLKFCGTWRHGKGPLSLSVNLTPGCTRVVVSANQSSLSVSGQITAQCSSLVTVPLSHTQPSKDETTFCVYWEPLLDQFKLKIGGEIFPLCSPAPLKDYCCTYLSHDTNSVEANFGIADGFMQNDPISPKTWTSYAFTGSFNNCRETFCDKASQGSPLNMSEKMPTKLQTEENPCAESTALKLEDNVGGYNVTLTVRSYLCSSGTAFY